MKSAVGEGWTYLENDLLRYDSIDTELDQIAKEFEQTSRRLIAMYAKIRDGDTDKVLDRTLAYIMSLTNLTANSSPADEAALAASEFGHRYDSRYDAFTSSQFMTFLEAVDADPEDEHPDFSIVRDIASDAREILDLTFEILGTTATTDETGPSDAAMADDGAQKGI